MELYILRHGIAEDAAPGGDRERALTATGKRKICGVARAMKRLGLRKILVVTSPLRRALETAELVAKELRVRKQMQTTKHLEPGSDAAQLIDWLSSLKPAPGRVVLVGHEPDLSMLVGLLTTGSGRSYLEFKKGGLCRVDVDFNQERVRGKLKWALTPKIMLKTIA